MLHSVQNLNFKSSSQLNFVAGSVVYKLVLSSLDKRRLNTRQITVADRKLREQIFLASPLHAHCEITL